MPRFLYLLNPCLCQSGVKYKELCAPVLALLSIWKCPSVETKLLEACMRVSSSLSLSVVYQGSLEQLRLAFATSVLHTKADSLRLMIKLQRLTWLMMLSFLKLAREINQGYALIAICVALSVQKMLLYTELTWSDRIHHPLIWPLYNCNRRVPFPRMAVRTQLLYLIPNPKPDIRAAPYHPLHLPAAHS